MNIFKKSEPKQETEKYVPNKDPHGLIQRDIQFIEENVPSSGYRKGDTLADVAYRQGQADLLNFIKKHFKGRT